MQHLRFELTHPSLAAPILLHSVGKFAPPTTKNGGCLWFSARDTPDEIIDGSKAQPSKQILPTGPLTPKRPMAVRVLLNEHVVFTGTATEWSYDDYNHQCFVRFSPLVAMHCNEVVERVHVPFHRYWREVDEPRYVGIVELGEAFFTPHVVSCFNKESN